MAKDEKIWIQNGYTSDIEIILHDEKGVHDEHFVFASYKMDRLTNQVISDGFTVLDKSDFDKLSNSRSLKKCIENGRLIVYDEPPASALSTADRIIMLQEKLRTLESENKSLRERLAKYEAETTDVLTEDAKEGAKKNQKGKNSSK